MKDWALCFSKTDKNGNRRCVYLNKIMYPTFAIIPVISQFFLSPTEALIFLPIKN